MKKTNNIWNIKGLSKCKYRSGMPIHLFGDVDRDGVANVFDCRPFNPRRQDERDIEWEHRKQIRKSVYDKTRASGANRTILTSEEEKERHKMVKENKKLDIKWEKYKQTDAYKDKLKEIEQEQ